MSFVSAVPPRLPGPWVNTGPGVTVPPGPPEAVNTLTAPANAAAPTVSPGAPTARSKKPLPSVPLEVDQQGYLTLTQIQEFFG